MRVKTRKSWLHGFNSVRKTHLARITAGRKKERVPPRWAPHVSEKKMGARLSAAKGEEGRAR